MRTRRIALLAVVLALAAVLQSTLGSRLIVLGARADLVLLLVVAHSIIRGMEEGLLGGLLGGVMVDLLSAVPFGTATLGMGLVGLVTGLGEINLYRSNLLIPLVAVFLATVLYHGFLMLALQAAGWDVEWIGTLALQTVPTAALNAVLVPLASPLVRRLVSDQPAQERIS